MRPLCTAGDSITVGYQWQTTVFLPTLHLIPGGHGTMELLKLAYPTDKSYWSTTEFASLTSQCAGADLVWMLGTNDANNAAVTAGAPSWALAQVYADCVGMVDHWRTVGVARQWIGDPPPDPSPYMESTVRPALHACAADTGTPMIDIHGIFVAHPEWMSSDHIHPTADGYTAIGQLVATTITAPTADAGTDAGTDAAPSCASDAATDAAPVDTADASRCADAEAGVCIDTTVDVHAGCSASPVPTHHGALLMALFVLALAGLRYVRRVSIAALAFVLVMLAASRADAAKLLLVGDEITGDSGGGGYQQYVVPLLPSDFATTTWRAGVYGTQYRKVTVPVGTTTLTSYWGVAAFATVTNRSMVDTYGSAWVVQGLGINDATYTKANGIETEQTLDDCVSMVKHWRRYGATRVFVLIPPSPISSTAFDTAIRPLLDQCVADTAADKIDAHDLFVGHPEYYDTDGIHHVAAGQQALAQYVASAVTAAWTGGDAGVDASTDADMDADAADDADASALVTTVDADDAATDAATDGTTADAADAWICIPASSSGSVQVSDTINVQGGCAYGGAASGGAFGVVVVALALVSRRRRRLPE